MPHLSPPDSCRVYTGQTLADAIVQRLGHRGNDTWLEPSVGPGTFVKSISSLGVNADRITAVDIDQDVCLVPELAQLIEGQDFIQWSLNSPVKFDRVAGNPPYVALSRVPKPLCDTALQVKTPWNRPIRKKSNYWFVFVSAIISLLKPGGSIGLILPAAWDYADYSAEMREYLPSLFRNFEVHRSNKPLFETVVDGAIVVIAEGYKEPPARDERFEHADAAALTKALGSSNNLISMPNKDTADCNGEKSTACTLKDIASVHIGAVTGDTNYFLFNEHERLISGIPCDCFRPILSRAKHIRAPEATKLHWQNLRDKGERVWLFTPSADSLQAKAVQEYLKRPPSEGGCNRNAYTMRSRDTWYSVNTPIKADGFLSGMSRTGPFICLNRQADLIASNTLYIINFRPGISQSQRYGWALSLMSSHAHLSILRLLRLYPDGLKKYEPKDLLRIELPPPRIETGVREIYRQAVQLHLNGEQAKSRHLADKYMDV